jgi:hypothetical protein
MSAVISSCGRYRYRLTRTWDASKNKLVFVMLNPSTADAEQDDPTIRKCIGFAKRLGYGGIKVVNLFAYRATDPKALRHHHGAHGDMVIGPENDRYLMYASENADGTLPRANDTLVVAWGGHGDHYPRRVRDVLAVVRRICKPMCLGYTKSRQPRHPLMLPYATELEAYRPETGI